ncbi:hypothetical protein RJ639_022081, partial [Escallonia herrerae]
MRPHTRLQEPLTDAAEAKDAAGSLAKAYDKILLDMVEQNELNRSFLALLDENISNANKEP